MIHEPHDLAHEFPELKERIHQLKTGDAHFRRLFDEYHTTSRQIERIEANIEPTSDAVLENFKKQRLALKDELYSLLKQAA